MKFPSIKSLADSAYNTFRRFPLEVMFALVGTIANTVNIELDNINRQAEGWCMRTILAANLGLLLCLAATLYAESSLFIKSKKILLRIAAVVLAIILFLIIDPYARQADYKRFLLLSLALHLLVAFAPFINKNSIQGFWQFNKTLFLRFLSAALYSVVLGVGLSAAIGATNYLFNLDFQSDTFAILWTWIIAMLGTVFFLAGVPADFARLNHDESYPKGLKIFTQYVLIPLASVYLLILLAYEIKITLQWDLPKGAVSYLILGYAVFGILSLLLVYPIREQDGNKWLKTYARSFYLLLLPLLVLLFAAVGVRVFNYGITEPRYFLIVLACWLVFITVYFLLFKKQNIKIIPISLCIATLFAVYGPQSAFSVSAYSQKRILTKLLKRNNAYKNGKAIVVKKTTKTDGRRMVSVITYLIDNHDLNSLQPFFTEDLDKIDDSLGMQKSEYDNFALSRYELRYQKVQWVQKKLNLEAYSGYRVNDNGVEAKEMGSYNYMLRNNILPIKGYDYALATTAINNDTAMVLFDGNKLRQQKLENKSYTLFINNDKVTFSINEIADTLLASNNYFEKHHYKDKENNGMEITYRVPADKLFFTRHTKNHEVTLVVENIHIQTQEKAKPEVSYLSGTYLIKKK